MQVEVGQVYEGIVKNIASYGLFVQIHLSDGTVAVGMVHISEISHKYVTKIEDFVTEGQQVRVKVIGLNPQGKISLSMKQTESEQAENSYENRGGREGHSYTARRGEKSQNGGRRNGSRQNTYEPKKRQSTEMSFEDMLSHFKQNSEERMGDIKRNTERKNRSRRK